MKLVLNRSCWSGLFFILAVVVVQPVWAQALTPEQLTLNVERLSESSRASKEIIQSIQKELKSLSADMARLGRLVDNPAMLEMLQRVDQLSDEISLLTGAIELQEHNIDGIKKQQRELYLDIDRRLREVESRATTQAPVGLTIPKTQTSTQPVLPASTASTSGEQTTTSEAAAQAAAAAAAAQTQAPSATQVEEKEAYQAAFDTLKEGRYKKAKSELNAFLEKYPNSSFAGNAQYWLGEAHYVTRNFSQGIIEFEKVLNQYSSSNKVPDAMLKLGYTYYELKQFDQSKQILQKLRDVFPKSTAARLAGKRLDRIRKEGH
jgi:tol-pal system protein YbgF